MMDRPKQGGFTLIEIMVVLAILGILLALVVPNVIGRPEEARITAAKVDLQAVGSALDIYKLDNYDYPSTEQGLDALVHQPSGEPEAKHWKSGGYLKKTPVDPWGNPYQYVYPGTHAAYDLYSFGPKGKAAQPNDPGIIGEWQ